LQGIDDWIYGESKVVLYSARLQQFTKEDLPRVEWFERQSQFDASLGQKAYSSPDSQAKRSPDT